LIHNPFLYNRQFIADVPVLSYSTRRAFWAGYPLAPDMEVVSKMETEAAECRWLAGKFKRKAESPWGGAHVVIAAQDHPDDRRCR
jgi:hypothetical protein